MALKYKELKEIIRVINFVTMIRKLIPTLNNVKDYFKELKLLN
jgi:hypothetical protein